MSTKHGWVMFARYLRVLHDGKQLTLGQFAEAAGLTVTHAGLVLRGWMTLGRVHIAGWQANPGMPSVALWAYGAGENAPYPGVKAARTHKPIKPASEMIAVESMLRLLESDALTRDELAEEAGVDATWASRFVTALHEELHMVYVKRWDVHFKRGGSPTARFRFGFDKRSAPRPKARDRNELAREYRARRKKRDAMHALVTTLAANASIFSQAQAA